MNALSAVLSPLSAVIGVIIGGYITFRSQSRQKNVEFEIAVYHRKQDACIALLQAVRRYRRYAMYNDVPVREVPGNETTKGSWAIEGSEPYIQAYDEAISQLAIVMTSQEVVEAARDAHWKLLKLLRSRARDGFGQIPTEIVHACRAAETEFAEISRQALQEESPMRRKGVRRH
ncbi:hypothetical protein [Amycolatopsis sp. MEPSY49]|uniref:hypothetical protein n=1 Tax=Amycolatopsis sp. MEPSY49 TaxID=3151600 RepID=UPI003F517ABC